MIKSIQPAGKWKTLIIDSSSLVILNSVCKLNEILDENVTLVEDIFRKRQAFPSLEAIYFISPTENSINALINDFTKVKMYAAAHVFFTSTLSDDLFALIKKSPALTFIKTLKEISVDFIAMESQVFSLEMNDNFFNIYNSSVKLDIIDAENKIIAKKLTSVLASLSELPNIRYYDPSNAKVNKSFKLATQLQKELDQITRDDPDFPPRGAQTSEKGTLIIVDRSFDMVAPLLHEFTYQAMMNDLLVLRNGKYSFKIDDSTDEKKTASLDENDAIWKMLRHWHFAEAVEYISDTFNRFLSTNKAAASAMGTSEG